MIEPVDPRDPSPGALLRHKRQHIGWTAEEVANALCLSPSLIRALESDEYEKMGGSTFILGYLRGYARLVNIDIEDAILSHRDKIPEYTPDPDLVPQGSGGGARTRRKSRSTPWLIAALVVAVVGGLGFLFWPKPVNEVGQVTEDLTIDRQESVPAPVSLEPVRREPPVRSDRMAGLDPAAVSAAARAGDPLPLNLTIADIERPRGVTTQGATNGSRTSPPVQAASADQSARTLVLMFDEGSWADVRDAAGKRLLSQTVAQGASIDLVGEPPFTVFLGNADGVRVKYMGKIQTYSQGDKGLFARFTVGKER